MAATIAAYGLILVCLGTDTRFRTDKKARQLTLDSSDRRSTQFLVIAFGISSLGLLLAPLLNHFHLGQFGSGWFWGWPGVLVMLLGIALRAWAQRVLGRFYTRTLLTTEDHRIVQDGPYRRIRHPGYSGSLMVWIGAGWAVGNWLVFALVSLACGASYLYRIKSEESMLMAKFGQAYTVYRQHTKRLIPFIY